ncbi:TPA: hypothetical protein ACH3X1_009458 [Trebouxia sp. C0004]
MDTAGNLPSVDASMSSQAGSPAAYQDLTIRRQKLQRERRDSPGAAALRTFNRQHNHQGLEVLMENVTSVGFTSCALRHNAKLPDLELAGGPTATGPAQAPLDRPPSTGVSSRPQSVHRVVQEGSYEGSTSVSLQHVLAGCSTAGTPRPQDLPRAQCNTIFLQQVFVLLVLHWQFVSVTNVYYRGWLTGMYMLDSVIMGWGQQSWSISASVCQQTASPHLSGGRPLSGRLRPTSASLRPIMEDSYASQDSVISGRASPLFPEAAAAYKVAGSRPTTAKWSKSRAAAHLTTGLQEQLNQKMGKLACVGVMQGGHEQPIMSTGQHLKP